MVALSFVFAVLCICFAIAFSLSDKSDVVNINSNLVPFKDIFKYLFLLSFLLTCLQFYVDYGSSNLVLVVLTGLAISIFMFVLLMDLVMIAIPAIVDWRRKRM